MTQKTNIEIILQRIADTILLNAGRVNKPGVCNGKTGIVLFLYHYTQINENKTYRDYAGELLDEIFNLIDRNMSVEFANGLTGIAWSIDYLTEKNFTDANSDVLEEVDDFLSTINYSDIISDLNNEYPLFSKEIYYIRKPDRFERREYILNELKHTLSQNTKPFHPNYLNSIMYTIFALSDNLILYPDLLTVLYTQMFYSIENKYYTLPDALVLKNIIEQFNQKHNSNFEYEKWQTLLKMSDYDNIGGILNSGIYNMIYNKTKIDNSVIMNKLASVDVEKQVDSMVKDVNRNLSLFNGLAGIGLTLTDCLLTKKLTDK